MTTGDTIAAIATALGRGGVAVIRVSGPEALAIAEKVTGKREEGRGNREQGTGNRVEGTGNGEQGTGNRVECRVRKLFTPPVPCSLFPLPSSLIDEAVVLYFRAPHSYTGEDVVEFQCHGGTVTPRRVLEACFAAGARLARRGEFTQRAFLNGRIDYDQAESVLDLVNARTARAADAALAGLSGRKRRELKSLYETALELSTRLEYALDVDEGELQSEFYETVDTSLRTLHAAIRQAVRRLTEGRLLRDGALVVLAGPPNAGKSSLMNALLEENRAIVSDIPGTTRDTIEEGLDLNGWPVRLVDTAGLRETGDVIESEGVRRTEKLLAQADVVLVLERRQDREGIGNRTILVHSKCDLGRGEGLNVSAKTGEGIEELKRTIVGKLEERVESADAGESGMDTSPLQESLAALSPFVSAATSSDSDLVLMANVVRSVAERIGTLVGATYGSDLLDNLFSRFCVGK